MRLLVFLFIIFPGLLFSQDFKLVVDPLVSRMEINFSNCNLQITGNRSDEIIIRSNSVLMKESSRITGLHVVGKYEDNTGMGLYCGKQGNAILIEKISASENRSYTLEVPNHLDLVLRETGWKSRSIHISGIKGKVQVKSNKSDIHLKGLQGPLVVETTGGNVEAELTNDGKSSRKFSSVSGRLEVLLPQDFKSDLRLETISGLIQSDISLASKKVYKGSNMRQVGPIHRAEVDLNGGGELLELSTVSGIVKIRVE